MESTYFKYLIVLFSKLYLVSVQLHNGKYCPLPQNNGTGICKNIIHCPHELSKANTGKMVFESSDCGLNDSITIVCCPKIPHPNGFGPAAIACITHELNGTLPNRTSPMKMWHGIQDESKGFPFLVAVGQTSPLTNIMNYFCGGLLISDKFVLSTADCYWLTNKNLTVKVGSSRINFNDNYEEGAQKILIEEIIMHPEYDNLSKNNNIALLKLKNPVTWSDKVKPICLQTKPVDIYMPVDGVNMTAVGWKSHQGIAKLQLKLVAKEKCLDNSLVNHLNMNNNNVICVEPLKKDNRRELMNNCSNVRGRFILRSHNNEVYLVGVNIFAIDFCNQPVAYINIDRYIDWIESNVWPELFFVLQWAQN
ncbi:trypsin V-B-like [Microplitis mediator]|uniref:trypsin V-B-like n=1 Tax=Microplitis mediator TaxID=375433 RepID=UPI002556938B|nr:trypsin V-B-like [Microplitis mediator]